MTVKMRTICGYLAVGLAAATALGAPPKPTGTFVQLTRAVATNSVADWRTDLAAVKAAGMDTLIVQWTAEAPVAYFAADTNDLPMCPETYATVERLFEAAGDSGLSIYLGLMNDPGYWKAITGRDRVLRDYFLLRVARNERLQKQLLARFGHHREWVGYYLAEEIDDLTWRSPSRAALLRNYLSLMTGRLKLNDPGRPVAVSAFFRGRTAPDIFARTLLDLTTNSAQRVDAILVQDGAGADDPPLAYIPLYYGALREAWTAEAPQLWGVVELFAQTSAEGKPFTAVPAGPSRVARQVAAAAPLVDRLVVFTLKDYADPSRGAEAARLHQMLCAPTNDSPVP
jgi:hypothetical protein